MTGASSIARGADDRFCRLPWWGGLSSQAIQPADSLSASPAAPRAAEPAGKPARGQNWPPHGTSNTFSSSFAGRRPEGTDHKKRWPAPRVCEATFASSLKLAQKLVERDEAGVQQALAGAHFDLRGGGVGAVASSHRGGYRGKVAEQPVRVTEQVRIGERATGAPLRLEFHEGL